MDQQRSDAAVISRPQTVWYALFALAAAGFTSLARAEPYLAVESGLQCSSCHVNPTGGGKRTPLGMLYARNQIAANTVPADGKVDKPWTGDVAKWFAVGADFRGGYDSLEVPNVLPKESEFDVTRATVYAEFRAIPNKLSFYFDEKVAPDNVDTREAYLLAKLDNAKLTIKAGQLFLPFGWRFEDDNTFVRQASGLNFNTPNKGVEIGLSQGKWSGQAAITENAAQTGGGADQITLSAVRLMQKWRVGASFNSNKDPFGDRRMAGAFAGVHTGKFVWLAEVDLISDDTPTGNHNSYATLVEGDWRFRKGHNLKVGYEFLDPNRSLAEDQQERYSVVWEYSPIQFVQSRVGIRRYNGIPNFPLTNRNEVFAQLHVYF
jgi:hypothetical protein